MIKNYFKTAWRFVWKNKTFSALNVLGLSVGISASLVIFLIVFFEFSFDTFEKDKDQIFRVVLDAKFGESEGHSAGVPAPLSNAIGEEIAGVEKVIPVILFQNDATVNVVDGNKKPGKSNTFKKQKGVIFTNGDYLDLLGFQWLAGDSRTSLTQPSRAVLTERRAKTYFPNTSPDKVIGKTITYNGIAVTVAGIVKEIDHLTDFKGNDFISVSTIAAAGQSENYMMEVWNDWMAYSQVYLKLRNGVDPAKMQAQINELFRKYNTDRNPNNHILLRLQPLSEIHFDRLYQSYSRIADKTTLYSLLGIAGFLLLLACINYINLSTAQSFQRGKEIGIRKTLGSTRKQLIAQVLGETSLITLLAILISVIIAPVLFGLFAEYIPEGLNTSFIYQPNVFLFLGLLALVIIFAAGAYPALILSGFRPISTLKNTVSISRQSRGTIIRKSLTVSQFFVAQFFVIVTVVVVKQINYSMDTDMGFNTKAVVKFNAPRDSVDSHRQVLLSKLQSIPGVELASSGFFAPADEGVAFTNVTFHDGKNEISPSTQIRWGDENYLKIYNIKLLAGRDITANRSVKELLVNESFVQKIGLKSPKDALGKYVTWNDQEVPIVGVMKDFHDLSLKSAISPMVFERNDGSTFHVKLRPNGAETSSWAAAIVGIEKSFKEMYSEEEFTYTFVDDMIASFYKREQATAGLLRWATGLCILISCLGLLGLVIYTTNTRIKEIGIRKVFGASPVSIIYILSKEFVFLVLLAFLLAAPVGWWVSHKWLQDYAFKTDINWWVYGLSGFLMPTIALITLSVRTLSAALANPVKSLRNE